MENKVEIKIPCWVICLFPVCRPTDSAFLFTRLRAYRNGMRTSHCIADMVHILPTWTHVPLTANNSNLSGPFYSEMYFPWATAPINAPPPSAYRCLSVSLWTSSLHKIQFSALFFPFYLPLLYLHTVTQQRQGEGLTLSCGCGGVQGLWHNCWPHY